VSEKALRRLAGAVVILCVLWLGVTFIPRGGSRGGGPSEAVAAFLSELRPEEVTAIRFQGPGGQDAVELTRLGDGWVVNGFPADSAAVSRLWETAEGIEVEGLVGTNPGNHPRLGVSADSAWTLEVEGPGGARDLLVGKAGARYGTTYVRLPDEDQVYLLKGSLRPIVTRNLEGWRNKIVARADTAAIQTLQLARGGSQAVLRRGDSLWTLEGGGEADATKARSILTGLARLDASGFYSPQDSLPGREGSVRALDDQGTTLLYLEIGSGEGDRWIRVEGDSVVYRIPSWRADQILPDLEGLSGGG
jgi:hypothetical protein